VWGGFPWQGYDPGALTYDAEPIAAHPQAVDQDSLTSWNNKPALGYSSADQNGFYSSIYRSQLLDAGIAPFLQAGRKMTLADLVNAMANAATQDLRGVAVLPWVLRVLGTPADPQLAAAVRTLRAWVAAGAHRIDRSGGGHYDDAAAVQLMDAWWPLLVHAEFAPALGEPLLGQLEAWDPIDNLPGSEQAPGQGHVGSSWDVGFYGVVQKDLRAVLRAPVRGPLSRVYCAGGVLARCRAALLASLRAALAVPASQVYPADGVCAAGDQVCADEIRFRPVGAITEPLIPWENRPTFQQAVEVQGHGPRS
jgi:hypothetical protein